MTPERLAECKHSIVAIMYRRGDEEGLEIVCEWCRRAADDIIRDLEAPPKCARGCDRDGVGSPCIHELSPDELTGVADHIRDLEGQLAAAREAKDYAYRQRDQLVAALSKVFPSGLGRHPESDTSWEDDWRNIVYIEFPTGQGSWHIHDSEVEWFKHLPPYWSDWDGHTDEEKYDRIADLDATATQPSEVDGFGDLIGSTERGAPMTPERLAELEQFVRHDQGHNLAENLWLTDDVSDLIAHIRDLEAQVREVPSIDDCLYHRCVEHWTVPGRNTTASSNGAECGACIERDWRSAFENYATHHNWCASGHGGMHVLGSPGSCDCGRDARLATATPPSPEVK